jgi:hypothetical protein
MKKKQKKIKPRIKKGDWCVMHWLGGEIKMFGTEKDCRDYAKRNSYNKNAPIFYAFPVAGVQLIIHHHEHIHTEKIIK